MIKIEKSIAEGYEVARDRFGLCHLQSVDYFLSLVVMEGVITFSI